MSKVQLRLKGVTGRWGSGLPSVAGHSQDAPVDIDIAAGEWISVAGKNGVGKSTLLACVAGLLPVSSGAIRAGTSVDSTIDAGDIDKRFLLGVQYVGQHASFQTSGDFGLSFTDAVAVATARRPALFNERVIDSLRKRLIEINWLTPDGYTANDRLFDLITAIISVPRVILLDEVIGCWPEAHRSSDRYKELRALLPYTSVLFVDHDSTRASEIANRVLWLLPDGRPKIVNVRDENGQLVSDLTEANHFIDQMRLTSIIDANSNGSDEVSSDQIVWLEESICTETRLASNAAKLLIAEDASRHRTLCNSLPFLRSGMRSITLSGGQRIMLAHLLALAVGRRVSRSEIVHLDTNYRKLVETDNASSS